MTLLNHRIRLEGLAAVAVAMVSYLPACAASFQDIYDFKGKYSDGQYPASGLAVDSVGRLIGSTIGGGAAGHGLVYRLTPPAAPGAPWTEGVLYDFASDSSSPTDPNGPVILQGDSTIFGTAAGGGPRGGGIAYRLDQIGEQWVLTTLHSFTGLGDGFDPVTGVTAGPSGLLYGVALAGGLNSLGTVYALSPEGDQTIFNFKPQTYETYAASRAIAIGSNRLVYTSSAGGASHLGLVIGAQETTPGHLHTSTLYTFGSSGDASNPAVDSPLVSGPKHVLLGCAAGGQFGRGAVYQLTPPAAAGSSWTEVVLYSFGAQPLDSDASTGECYIATGSDGHILGVTTRGGAQAEGSLFALSPPTQAGGAWTEKVVHSFTSQNYGLYMPAGVPVQIGNTYFGTAMFGGFINPTFGTGGGVWSYTP